MSDLFNFIWDIVKSFIDIIKELIDFLTNIPSLILNMISIFPPEIQILFLSIIAIIIIVFIYKFIK